MDQRLNRHYPSCRDLEIKAAKRLPKMIREMIMGGMGEGGSMDRNRRALNEILLRPQYLREPVNIDLRTEFLGKTYDAPFGISPVGLGDLAWPKAAQLVAQAAANHNVAFGASTFTLPSLETLRSYTGDCGWFQLYHPKEPHVTDDLLRRARIAGYDVLAVTVDVPFATRRDHDIRNGFTLPAQIGLRNGLDFMAHPRWALAMAFAGFPQFGNLQPYLDKTISKNQALGAAADLLAQYVSPDMLYQLRQKWDGKLLIKGILSPEDAKLCQSIGADGIIVSNHGGRQLEAAESPCQALPVIRKAVGPDFPLVAESGMRTGLDICRMLSIGADFVMAGRPFYYAMAAIGAQGGDHAISILKEELRCTMGQLGCDRPNELPTRLISD